MTSLIDPEPSSAELHLFHRIYRKSVELMSKDGSIQPIAFFRAGDHPRLQGPSKGMIIPVQMDMPGNDHGKDGLAQLLRHLAKDLDADLVLLVLESWLVKPTPAEAQYIQQTGEFAVRPSQHPDRMEIVLFTMQAKNGDSWSTWVEILRDSNNKPSIPSTPPKLEYLKCDGRFGNLFEQEGGDGCGRTKTTYKASCN